jgi:hypothetical protein
MLMFNLLGYSIFREMPKAKYVDLIQPKVQNPKNLCVMKQCSAMNYLFWNLLPDKTEALRL